MNRQIVTSGTPWESAVGYSRAVKAGNQIFISGTTASTVHGEVIAPGDAYGQTRCVLERIEAALVELGASLSDVVRTRMYVIDIEGWEEIGRAHAEAFGEIKPAATMVQVSRLVDPDHLVEIEADAVIG